MNKELKKYRTGNKELRMMTGIAFNSIFNTPCSLFDIQIKLC
jgi:hypothetical protein